MAVLSAKTSPSATVVATFVRRTYSGKFFRSTTETHISPQQGVHCSPPCGCRSRSGSYRNSKAAGLGLFLLPCCGFFANLVWGILGPPLTGGHLLEGAVYGDGKSATPPFPSQHYVLKSKRAGGGAKLSGAGAQP